MMEAPQQLTLNLMILTKEGPVTFPEWCLQQERERAEAALVDGIIGIECDQCGAAAYVPCAKSCPFFDEKWDSLLESAMGRRLPTPPWVITPDPTATRTTEEIPIISFEDRRCTKCDREWCDSLDGPFEGEAKCLHCKGRD